MWKHPKQRIMKWLIRVFITLIVLSILIIVISFFLPKAYHVERSAAISAAPETVYGIINNLKTYDGWMPWNQIDSNMQKTYGPKTVGEGAWYSWTSTDSHVGTGKLTIIKSEPGNVATNLDFGEMGSSVAGWTVEPDASNSRVTWYLDGRMDEGNFFMQVMSKWMSAVGVFDKMVGADFEKGLNNLKTVAEAPNARELAAPGLPRVEMEEIPADTVPPVQ